MLHGAVSSNIWPLFLNPFHLLSLLSSSFALLFSGQFGSQRLAGDLGFCRGPGCDEGSSHQCRAGDFGARGQSLSKTGEGQPDGRVEVLHLLWVSSLPLVGSVDVRVNEVVL